VQSSRRTCTRKPLRYSAFWMVTLLTKTRRMVQGTFCILSQAPSMVPTRQKKGCFTSSLVYSEQRARLIRTTSFLCRGGKAQLKLSDCRSEHERARRVKQAWRPRVIEPSYGRLFELSLFPTHTNVKHTCAQDFDRSVFCPITRLGTLDGAATLQARNST